MAYEQASGSINLTEIVYRSFRMMVSVERGVLKLKTIDLRSNDALAPTGLRRYRESSFPAPIYALSGNFAEDSRIAREWLELHKAHIRDADADRPTESTHILDQTHVSDSDERNVAMRH